jgi:glycolate oxidase iron-sulfur subunit
MLTGCVQSVFFEPVNAATARVLAAEGCEVVIPRGQTCCGALAVHNGRPWDTTPLQRIFADVDFLVVNAAGCGSALKEGPLAGKTRDLSEMLIELGPVAPRHPLRLAVAYQDACHLGHAQKITRQPRELLRAIPELELRELAEPEICCGSAGIWNVLHPGPGRELGERKARFALATEADLLVSANPGCMMQIGRYVKGLSKGGMPMAHTAQVLDASIRGLPAEALTDQR